MSEGRFIPEVSRSRLKELAQARGIENANQLRVQMMKNGFTAPQPGTIYNYWNDGRPPGSVRSCEVFCQFLTSLPKHDGTYEQITYDDLLTSPLNGQGVSHLGT